MFARKIFCLPLFLIGVYCVQASDGTTPEDALLERQADVAEAVGLVRHFHPHDAVEAVDWNGVLLEAFALAADAPFDADFASGLTDLLGSLGTGMERTGPGERGAESGARECEADDPAIRWVHRGFAGAPIVESPGRYSSRRSISGISEADEEEVFSVATKMWPAEPWHGRSLSLSAEARVLNEGQAALWVRVDASAGETLFFDNMADRFIESEDWSKHTIEFEVPERAQVIMFGVIAMGEAHAEFRQVMLEDRNASDDDGRTLLSATSQWELMSRRSAHTMEAEFADEGFLLDLSPEPIEPQLADIDRFIPDDAPHYGSMELIDGSTLRVPLVLCQSESRLDETNGEEALANRFGSPGLETVAPEALARLDVAVLWPVLRHFYPYQELVDDWPGLLHTALADSLAVNDRESQRRVLQRMLVPLQDGHVRVVDTDESARVEQALLPIVAKAIDGELVVANSRSGDDVQPGDRIVAVDGEPAEQWIADRRAHHSGSLHWQMRLAGIGLIRGPIGEMRSLRLARGDELIDVDLAYELDELLPVFAHEPVGEPSNGIIYVNLSRVEQGALHAAIERMAEARGVVFDLRGYPGAPVQSLLGHLMDSDDDWEGWMRVLAARAPGGDLVEAERLEWALPAREPHIGAPVLFLTDENAISYSESVLGLVKYHRLGTIVGSNTAGSNGNALFLNLPGNFRVQYTGMRVIGPDGEPFQGKGIEPDVRVRPTIDGLQAGRDEVLERALELLD